MPLTCPHFGSCGGCQTLTTPTAQQRAARIDEVQTALGSHLPEAPLRFTDSPTREPRHDRLRVLYPVQPDAKGQVRMGLYRAGTHDTIEIESCELQHPALTEFARRAQEVFVAREIPPYDESHHRGLLRALSLRLSASTGELLIGVVTASPNLPDPHGLATELVKRSQGLTAGRGKPLRTVGVVHNVHRERGNQLTGARSKTLVGRDHIIDKVDGMTFRVSFGSFYQLHRRADQLLYRPALQMIAPWLPRGTVVDAFGGVGTFALRCARLGAKVTLIDNSASACADARSNAKTNSTPINILEADVPTTKIPTPDLLLVDPSRAGLRPEGRDWVRELAPPRILYVACGLKALARDLDDLPDYRLEHVQLADLFPHTAHVETLALAKRIETDRNL